MSTQEYAATHPLVHLEVAQTPSEKTYVGPVTQPLLDIIGARYTTYRVFTDWVDLMVHAFSGDMDAYNEITDKYDEEHQEKLHIAFQELLALMDEYKVDVIGDVYEILGANSKQFGQYFTPHDLSETMVDAVSTTTDDSETGETIHDPTCGSGRLLIAAARQNQNNIFTGIDKDGLCAKMTLLNLTFYGLHGQIAHGDCLTMEFVQTWGVKNCRIFPLSDS